MEKHDENRANQGKTQKNTSENRANQEKTQKNMEKQGESGKNIGKQDKTGVVTKTRNDLQ